MKIFHTADWHLGKLVQGVYMTEDQKIVLEQFTDAIQKEKPDVIIIAGDLYDRSVPPVEAVHLLNDVLKKIVIDLHTPVLAIAGNHDSPERIHFGYDLLKEQGLYLVGQLQMPVESVVLEDEYGPVYFHIVPYVEPGHVRHLLDDPTIKNHDDALAAIVRQIESTMDKNGRHVFIGHAFVTQYGEKEDNTSSSERPLSIGGSEYVQAKHFKNFDYTALGHLHQAHYVLNETIRYSGSLLKYSISEEKHQKGFYSIDLSKDGETTITKRLLHPRRDMRVVKGTIEEILTHEKSDDYVFVQLLNESPVLFPMEKVRTVYPNAMHVERVVSIKQQTLAKGSGQRAQMDTVSLFQSFYKEVSGTPLTAEKEQLFKQALDEMLKEE